MNTHSFPSCTQMSQISQISKKICVICGNLRPLFQVVFWACLFMLGEFQAVFAQTPTPQVNVALHVLTADGKPITGIRVELILFQYAMSVEPLAVGGCETDATGSCAIETDLPPSISPDWYEGVVYVADLGRQLVGWQGNTAQIVIHINPEGLLPTEEPHLHGPYTGEQYAPTEGSPATETSRPRVTPTPQKTITPTFTPQPLTPLPLPVSDEPETAFPIGWLLVGGLCVALALCWVLAWRVKRHG